MFMRYIDRWRQLCHLRIDSSSYDHIMFLGLCVSSLELCCLYDAAKVLLGIMSTWSEALGMVGNMSLIAYRLSSRHHHGGG